ncbi:putative rho-type gtpase-activating protein 1 protein [Eutypa lata UCREL1]|uniref:Putative rho-type gtpase-activating protein 1 protein n=1 Tax=Eutypa lata (strain UCR-EL1) TaxID=1287681 RepID=M7SBL7_EUTLA|nr:putative rho-type gtpase-activating protein 1 protein [Eutypa lata UCREL1]
MDGPEGRTVRPGSAGGDNEDLRNRSMQIEEERDQGPGGTTEQYFGHQDALTLDDIPRIVAAEQAREHQPSAYRQSRQELFRSPATEPPYGAGSGAGTGHQRSLSDGRDADFRAGERSPQRGGGRKFFSELSGLEYFIVRHLAVLSMQPLLDPDFTLEELLTLIEARKAPNFWNKFGKAFGGKDTRKASKKKGVFGVPLDVVVERDGADSTDGVGPGALRIPAIVEDTITALKNKDLSVEGVFRKNGNIKKLTEQIDEDTGSRMDVHNLARVIAPNVLYTNNKAPSFSDEPMTAVACVEELIQNIEEMCMVPAELMDVLGDSTLWSGNGDITTKEILKRIEGRAPSGNPKQYDASDKRGVFVPYNKNRLFHSPQIKERHRSGAVPRMALRDKTRNMNEEKANLLKPQRTANAENGGTRAGEDQIIRL